MNKPPNGIEAFKPYRIEGPDGVRYVDALNAARTSWTVRRESRANEGPADGPVFLSLRLAIGAARLQVGRLP